MFDFNSSYTVKNLNSKIQEARELNRDIQVAFLDFAGRIVGENDSMYVSSTKNALAINDVCKNNSVHWMVLSQIGREKGDHTDALLSSRVSKESGSWEENASFMLNVWRPFGLGVEGHDRYYHIYTAKNRKNNLEERVFGWNGKKGTIYEIDEQQFHEYTHLCTQFEKRQPPNQFSIDSLKKGSELDIVKKSDKSKSKVEFIRKERK
jgi:hypothetical protein